MDYKELEDSLRAEAAIVAGEKRTWRADEVSLRITQIAEQLARIRREHAGGIDASMGKRSGWKVEI